MQFSTELLQVIELVGQAVGLAMGVLVFLIALARIAADFLDFKL